MGVGDAYKPVLQMREKAALLRQDIAQLSEPAVHSTPRKSKPSLRIPKEVRDDGPSPIERVSGAATYSPFAASSSKTLASNPSDSGGPAAGTHPLPAMAAGSTTSAAPAAGAAASMHGPGKRLVSTRLSHHPHDGTADGPAASASMQPTLSLAHAAPAGASAGPRTSSASGAGGWVPDRERGFASSPTRAHSPSFRLTSPTRAASNASVYLAQEQQRGLGRNAAMEEELDRWKQRVHELEADVEKRQQSYMRREEVLTQQVQQLESALQRAKSEAKPVSDSRVAQALDKSSTAIKDLHEQVISEIEDLLSKQAVVIKHEEASTLRHFKDKLSEIEVQVAAERRKNTSSESEWLARTASMRQELEHTHALAVKLDSMYKLSEQEGQRLRAQYKCQEDDRQYLVRQIVSLKQENARLGLEVASMAQELQEVSTERDQLLTLRRAGSEAAGDEASDLTSGAVPSATGGEPSSTPAKGPPGGKESVETKLARYEEVVQSLRRLAEAERRRTKQARAAHTAELAQRTELQALLRQCVEDVRTRRLEAEASGGSAGAGPGPGSGQQQHRAARARPFSAQVPRSGLMGVGSGSGNGRRPVSATNRGGGGGSGGARRPFSAAVGGGSSSAAALLEDDELPPGAEAGLRPEERQQLVQDLLSNEEILQLLFVKAFPAAAAPPLEPGDALLDALVAKMDEEEKQVVATARALGQRLPASTAAQPQAGSRAAAMPLASGTGLPPGFAPRPASGRHQAPLPSAAKLASTVSAAAAGASGAQQPHARSPAADTPTRSGWSALDTDARMADFLTGKGRGGPAGSGVPAGGGSSLIGGGLASWGRPVSAASTSRR